MSESIIEFQVKGFAEPPDEVARRLQLGDDAETWKAGQVRTAGTILVHSSNGLRLRRKTDPERFEQDVASLLEHVLRSHGELARLNAECEFRCIFYCSGSERPVAYFTKDALRHLADLRASLDIDYYYVGSPGEPSAER